MRNGGLPALHGLLALGVAACSDTDADGAVRPMPQRLRVLLCCSVEELACSGLAGWQAATADCDALTLRARAHFAAGRWRAASDGFTLALHAQIID